MGFRSYTKTYIKHTLNIITRTHNKNAYCCSLDELLAELVSSLSKCYITGITWALVVYVMCRPSALRLLMYISNRLTTS